MDAEIERLTAAVATALDETEREYAQLPFFVRPIVRRGFARRTGRDFAGWRVLLDAVRLGAHFQEAADALAALAEHYRGAPERAKRGMGATPAQLEAVARLSRARADAALALRAALRPAT